MGSISWAFFGVCKANFPGPGVLLAIEQNPYQVCEIGLKTPSNIDEKASDVGLLGGVESSVWSSERPGAVLLGFWTASEATSWRSRLGVEALAARLPFTTQLDFEPLRRPVGVPHHRDMSTSRVEWCGTEVACACVPPFYGPIGGFW